MREELVLKTAVLAERFYPDLHWYVDSMLKLIERAGELASKDIWHSTVQLITNYPSLHEYAARKVRPSLVGHTNLHLLLKPWEEVKGPLPRRSSARGRVWKEQKHKSHICFLFCPLKLLVALLVQLPLCKAQHYLAVVMDLEPSHSCHALSAGVKRSHCSPDSIVATCCRHVRAGAGVAAGRRVARRAGVLRGLRAGRVRAPCAGSAHACAIRAAAGALPHSQQRDQGAFPFPSTACAKLHVIWCTCSGVLFHHSTCQRISL